MQKLNEVIFKFAFYNYHLDLANLIKSLYAVIL